MIRIKMELVYEYSYGEESYGLVYKNEDGLYAVYEIPQYGGEERFCKTCASLEDAITLAKSFT